MLQEMFPNIPKSVIRTMRVDDNLSVELIIDCLVESNGPKLPLILKEHAEKVMDLDDNVIHVTRSCVYNKAMIYYKSAVNNPSELKKPITVIFSGEEGADLGALRNEFLIETFRKVREDWFEGQNERLVPKIEWGFEDKYKLVGAMIAHSVLQGGPGFACIHPAIYIYDRIWENPPYGIFSEN